VTMNFRNIAAAPPSVLAQLGIPSVKKPSKYRAIKTVDRETGEVLDSKAEARRYTALRKKLRDGEIFGLSRQCSFVIEGAIYVADFVYYEHKSLTREFMIVEDVKGMKTAHYKQKKRQMKERYGVEILET
jgi:Protein of unknown function (DUF1064)